MVAVVTGWLVSAGLGATAAGIVAELAISVVLSGVSRALMNRDVDMSRELDLPKSVPPKRFVYGRRRIVGTWAPGWIVGSGYLYGCLILNSRPSDGVERIFFDKREVLWTGDIEDFAVGATATNGLFSGHVKMWLGKGGQTAPPAQILAEMGDLTGVDTSKLWPTDGWQGQTVLWVRLFSGKSKQRAQRWPNGRPQIEVEGRWSRVWDPRDVAQDPDDQDTWEWSQNHGLCLIDALRTNPISRVPLAQLHMPSMLRQVELSDEIAAGDTAPNYRVGGTIVWGPGQEFYQAFDALTLAGGGDLVTVGGKLGYRPGEYLAPSATVDDVLDTQPLRFTAEARGRDVPRGVRVVWPDPAADWEMATQPPLPVPGGGGLTGGDDRIEELVLDLVPFGLQAWRLGLIRAKLAGAQKRLSGVLPPRYLDLMAGATMQAALPRSGDARNGTYMLHSIQLNQFLDDEADPGGQVALRLPFEAREMTADIYDHTGDTPPEFYTPALAEPDGTLPAPAALVLAEGTDGISNVLRLTLTPPADPWRVQGYEFEWSADAGDWQPGGAMAISEPEAGTPGAITGRLPGVMPGVLYQARARSTAPGRVSDWTLSNTVTPAGGFIIDAGTY